MKMNAEERRARNRLLAAEHRQSKKHQCVYCDETEELAYVYADLRRLTGSLRRNTMPSGGTPVCLSHNDEIVAELRKLKSRNTEYNRHGYILK